MSSKKAQRQRELELHRAIGSGDVEKTSRLLSEGVDPNCVGESSRGFKYAFTALCTAIHAADYAVSQPKVIATLREACPGARFVDTDFAELRANCILIIGRLFAAGTDPNRPTYSRTPLSLAAFTGDTEVVRLLLDAGANPAGEGWSPFSKLPRPKGGLAFYGNAIHQAAEKGFVEVVQLLCSRGANPLAKDHEGKTALQLAREHGHKEVSSFLEQYECSNVSSC